MFIEQLSRYLRLKNGFTLIMANILFQHGWAYRQKEKRPNGRHKRHRRYLSPGFQPQKDNETPTDQRRATPPPPPAPTNQSNPPPSIERFIIQIAIFRCLVNQESGGPAHIHIHAHLERERETHTHTPESFPSNR